MFALDNIVKKTVHTAITILSPELGANLAGHERLEEEFPDADIMSGGSAVSTVNSTKPKKMSDAEKQISKLNADNVKLLQDLLDTRKMYQNLLKATIEEQNLNLSILKNYNRQMGQVFERSVSLGWVIVTVKRQYHLIFKYYSYNSDVSEGHQRNFDDLDAANNNRLMPPPAAATSQQRRPSRRITFSTSQQEENAINTPPATLDDRLNNFLIGINVDAASRNLILNSDFTYEDFVYEMDKDDLRRLGLK